MSKGLFSDAVTHFLLLTDVDVAISGHQSCGNISTQSLTVMTKLYKLNPLAVKPAILPEAFRPFRLMSGHGC